MLSALFENYFFIIIFVYMTKEERKEYNKRYWEKHKEELKLRAKQYKKEHRTELNEYAKQYRQKNLEKIRIQENEAYHKRRKEDPEKIKEQRRRQRENHKDVYLKAQEKFNNLHPEKRKEYSKNYKSTKNGKANALVNSYIRKDIEHNRGECTLTKQWIIDNIFNSSCIYCGDSDWTHLGADRIDNSKPHTPENCVCACTICNLDRQDRYTVEEFKEYRKTHPRELGKYNQKSWEIVEMKGIKVLKKRAI